jgi:hypothetical protein
MADYVEDFIDRVRSVGPLSPSNKRRLAVRQKITEFEHTIRSERDPARAIPAFLQRAMTRASKEISQHSRNNIPKRTAAFFQEVFDELSIRTRLIIQELKDDTFQVEVKIDASDGALTYVIKSNLYSLVAAHEWIDSEQGNMLIKAVIAKYEK